MNFCYRWRITGGARGGEDVVVRGGRKACAADTEAGLDNDFEIQQWIDLLLF